MAIEPRRRGSRASGSSVPESPRELIVIMRPEAEVVTARGTLRSRSGMTVDPVQKALRDAGATIAPLFGATEERVRSTMGSFAAESGSRDPAAFYKVEAEDRLLDELAAELARAEPVEAAYVKPPASPPSMLHDAILLPDEAPPATPDFTGRQGYLGSAPGGIDARWAWTQPGGQDRKSVV